MPSASKQGREFADFPLPKIPSKSELEVNWLELAIFMDNFADGIKKLNKILTGCKFCPTLQIRVWGLCKIYRMTKKMVKILQH